MGNGPKTNWMITPTTVDFSAAIMFLVAATESNIIDQRWLEFKVHQINSKVRVLRATFADVSSKGSLTDDKKFYL